MARNKHPEQTVQKILDVSLKLFGEKGYEKTTCLLYTSTEEILCLKNLFYYRLLINTHIKRLSYLTEF